MVAATNTETEPRPVDRNPDRRTVVVVAGRIPVRTEAVRRVAVGGVPVRRGPEGDAGHRHVTMQSLDRTLDPTGPREPVAAETAQPPSPNGTAVRVDATGMNSWCGVHVPTHTKVSRLGGPRSNRNLQHDHGHSNSHHSESHGSAPCLVDRVSGNRQPAGEEPEAGLPSDGVEEHAACQNGVSQHVGFFRSGNPSQHNNLPILAHRKTPDRRRFRPGASRLPCRTHESGRGQSDDKSSRPPD